MFTFKQQYEFLQDQDQDKVMCFLHDVLKHRGRGNFFEEVRNQSIDAICEVFLRNGMEIEQLT